MSIRSFLKQAQRSTAQTSYTGRALVYNDSKTGRGQDKAVLWFPNSEGKMPSIDQKLKALGITFDQLRAIARVVYRPVGDHIHARFSIIDYTSQRNLNQADENGRFDAQKTRAKEQEMKMHDVRLILDVARQMKRLPTHPEYGQVQHPLKTPERAWHLFNRKKER